MADPKVRLPFEGQQRLTQGFGENPAVYKRLGLPGHNGIDWGMPVGTPILAVDDGEVILRKDDPEGFGLHIKLQHDWGQSLYAHLSEFKVRLHDRVSAGDVIGLSGDTGFSTGPHLHFGLRVKPYRTDDGWNGYTNPQRFLRWDTGEEALDTLREQVQQLQQELADTTGAFAFERQELTEQADLWRKAVTDLLHRYLPGELPPDTDVLITLQSLMDSWAEELDKQRNSLINNIFGSS
ncbi:MAG: M23 family metallopeptidase [Caldilineae bacterium]|nr:MAG: M23 family metallopeptidase [Caldilineae bacterium]